MKEFIANNLAADIVNKKSIRESNGQCPKIILKTNCVTRSMRKKIDSEDMQSALSESNSSMKHNTLKRININYKTRAKVASNEKFKRTREESYATNFKKEFYNNNKELKCNFRINSLNATRKYLLKQLNLNTLKSMNQSSKVKLNINENKKRLNSYKLNSNIVTKKFFSRIPKLKIIEENETITDAKKSRSNIAAKIFQKSLPLMQLSEENPILNRLMYNVPVKDALQGHDTSPQIIKAIMLLWENSGRGNFARLSDMLINDDLNNEQNSHDMHLNSILKELEEEILTLLDQSNIIKKCNERIGNTRPLLTCASCGERTYTNIYKEFCVTKDLQILKLTKKQIEAWNNLMEYKGIASVTSIDNVLYNIHPECITNREGNYFTLICKECYDDIVTKVIPKFSVANGHDYGDIKRISGLLPLTIVEKHLISRNRIYGSIMEIKEGSNRQLIGNIITFEHDGPERCAEKFDFPDVNGILKSLKVAFVGSKHQYEKYRKDVIMTCGELQVRTENVYNWLKMLKQCNPMYWNISINES